MKPSKDIKPISYLKAHAAEMIRELGDTRETVIITQRGEAKAVLQDIHAYEDLQASLALLKMLAQSRKSITEGRSSLASRSLRRARDRARRLLEG